MIASFLFVMALVLGSTGVAQTTSARGAAKGSLAKSGAKASAAALMPEALSVKALLEELMSKRYAAEIGTFLETKNFQVAAQLELIEIPKKVTVPPPTPLPPNVEVTDLTLGTLDPEELLQKFSKPEQAVIDSGVLRNYKIRSVLVSVGLKGDLAPEIKEEVKKWLEERVKLEFGDVGSSTVTDVKSEIQKVNPVLEKQPLDLLQDFQNLAGQLALVLGILFAVILWRLLGNSKGGAKGTDTGEGANANGGAAGTGAEAGGSGGGKAVPGQGELDRESLQKREDLENEQIRLGKELGDFSERLLILCRKNQQDVSELIRVWSSRGEAGLKKVAAFAEAVGSDVGRLPIPIDAMSAAVKVFNKMSSLNLQEKRDLLENCYWDLLTVSQLGVDALNQPFGYLGSMNFNVISQALMEQNPRMKTLVAQYLSDDYLSRYLQGLTTDVKLSLLTESAELNKIPAQELGGLSSEFETKMQGERGDNLVVLDGTFAKIAKALTAIERITMLVNLKGEAIDSYKKSTPSLAFLGAWEDDSFRTFLAKCTPDEVLALIRVRPDLKDRVMALCPPMTAEMVDDEFKREDKSSDADKNVWLEQLDNRLAQMISLGEISLEKAIGSSESGGASSADAAGGVDGVDSKRSA